MYLVFDQSRTVCLRKDKGQFVGDLQEAYDLMAKSTSQAQVHIPEIFWQQDEARLRKERESRATKNRPATDSWELLGVVEHQPWVPC